METTKNANELEITKLNGEIAQLKGTGDKTAEIARLETEKNVANQKIAELNKQISNASKNSVSLGNKQSSDSAKTVIVTLSILLAVTVTASTVAIWYLNKKK